MAGRLLAVVTVAAGLVVLTGPAATGHHDPVHVVVHGYRFEPSSVTVTAGTVVSWSNEDAASHDVSTVSGPASFRSPRLEQGQSWSTLLAVSGEYHYVCTIHPEMMGAFTVTAPPSTTSTSAATLASDAPAAPTELSTTTTSEATSTSLHAAHATAVPTDLGRLTRLAAVAGAVVLLALLLLGRRSDS
jgi:plastocyanin